MKATPCQCRTLASLSPASLTISGLFSKELHFLKNSHQTPSLGHFTLVTGCIIVLPTPYGLGPHRSRRGREAFSLFGGLLKRGEQFGMPVVGGALPFNHCARLMFVMSGNWSPLVSRVCFLPTSSLPLGKTNQNSSLEEYFEKLAQPPKFVC